MFLLVLLNSVNTAKLVLKACRMSHTELVIKNYDHLTSKAILFPVSETYNVINYFCCNFGIHFYTDFVFIIFATSCHIISHYFNYDEMKLVSEIYLLSPFTVSDISSI